MSCDPFVVCRTLSQDSLRPLENTSFLLYGNILLSSFLKSFNNETKYPVLVCLLCCEKQDDKKKKLREKGFIGLYVPIMVKEAKEGVEKGTKAEVIKEYC